ncbi:MAG: DUF1294 domain-containing protein [Moraxellaceae bacterium]|nr:MAG: DUF1294 domain-containing protein [Moraxellaceae bacterium]
MRYQGQLIEWHDDQGYGFIQPMQTASAKPQPEQRIFLHIKSFAKRGPRPLAGALLEYEIAPDSKGRLNAQRVSYVRRQSAKASNVSTRHQSKAWRGWVITLYAAFIIALQLTHQLPVWAIAIPLLLSALTYLVYDMDKKAAQQGRQRIPEKNLHLLSLLGGWPGALLAQQKLRHKSAKVEFLQIFWVTVALNWVLLIIVSMPLVRQFF